MPFTQYVCPKYSEPLEASSALDTVLTRAELPALRNHDLVKDFISDLIKRAHALPITLALVDGTLENTPAAKLNTFEPNSEFAALLHRALTFLPAKDSVIPVTALCQIIFHAREYHGDSVDEFGLKLKSGDQQVFVSLYYAEHYGLFSIMDGDEAVSEEMGVVAGSFPHVPPGIATKSAIDAISSFGTYCNEITLPAVDRNSIQVNKCPFYSIEDPAHAEWDSDALDKFVKMPALSFIDPLINEREKLLRMRGKHEMT